ncbi:hypothetical protein [Shewanella xiamenensis]|uniref:hypothetical protein n=1 Tax=Shewanella xiamenensis TaxID=332186 RepID=UPI0016692088|nr:hypothetical protein [Shewanella xiamenensis]MCL1069896.1 hypothetical protein [Shewanella xiamenensis]MCR4536761.1 hypothetical protein [Shewanella xiamenensis]WHF54332.1 hypothetical protein OCF84_13000 [Shewanella xiamenensis]
MRHTFSQLAPFMWGFFLPETGQFDQRSGQCLPVEVISRCQQGGQFDAAPPIGGTGVIDRFCCSQVITSTVLDCSK